MPDRKNAGKRRAAGTSVAVLLLAMLACNVFAQDETNAVNRIIPYPTHVERLDNGLEIIVMPMPGNGLVAYWSIVRTGSRDEYEPGRSGFAHFFEHMMFRGTDRYPAEEYQRVLTEIGADFNAYTTDDYTAYHFSMAAADLETVMDLESDRFRNLAYSEPDFRTEAGAVYGEYRMNRTNPIFVIYEGVRGTAFEQHTYGHTTIGYERDIAAMPEMYEYSRLFFSRYYRPDNTTLMIVGDVEPRSAVALAKRYYGDWQPGYEEPPVPREPEQTEERRIELTYDGRTLPVAWIAYKIDAFDPDNRARVAADLLSELAFGPTSDVYRRLVLEEQAVEFLAADAGHNRDPSLLDIYTRIKDPDKVEYVLEVIEETIDAHRRSLIDAERLAALKSRLRYGFLMGLDTPSNAADSLARPLAVGGELESIEALHAAYETITPEDVRQAARTYLAPERRTVGILRGAQ